MLSTIFHTLFSGAPEPLAEADARTALAALLVRVARADDDYALAEQQRINRILAQRYALDEADAHALRVKGEALEAHAPDTVRFTKALKVATAYEDRAALMEALWSVALADGGHGAQEDQALRMISNLLGLSDVESALARQRAAR